MPLGAALKYAIPARRSKLRPANHIYLSVVGMGISGNGAAVLEYRVPGAMVWAIVVPYAGVIVVVNPERALGLVAVHVLWGRS